MDKNIPAVIATLILSLFVICPATAQTQQVEAEDYTGMSGIRVQATADQGGGNNVGWVDPGDWLSYAIPLPAGEYRFSYRVAGHEGGERFRLESADGQEIYTSVAFDATGGWQNWKTVETQVELASDIEAFRLYAVDGNWNLNWLRITPLQEDSSSSTDSPDDSSSSDNDVRFRVEAEDYLDLDGMQTEPTQDDGGGENLGWVDVDDWVSFRVDVPEAGDYRVRFRVAGHGGAENRFTFESADIEGLSEIVGFAGTGDWQSWITVEELITLPAGETTIMLRALNGDWNINWLEFELLSGDASSSDTDPNSESGPDSGADTGADSGSDSNGETGGSESPSGDGGSSSSPDEGASSDGGNLTLRIEAENYKEVNGMRAQATQDVGGGQNIGWVDVDDWISYSIDLPETGDYKVRFRVSGHGRLEDRFILESGDIEGLSEPISFEGTGNWQSWMTVEKLITLPAEEATIVLRALNGEWNINWLEFELIPDTGSEPDSGAGNETGSDAESGTDSGSGPADGSGGAESGSLPDEPPGEYLISTQTDGFGVITPSEILVQQGGSALFTVTASDGYVLASISGCAGVLDQEDYSVSNITSDCVIEAAFKEIPDQQDESSDDRYQVSAIDNSVVKDLSTGLEWKRCPEGSEWSGTECVGEGNKYRLDEAQSLEIEGDWRVPSREELNSIVHCSEGEIVEPDYNSTRCESNSLSPTLDADAFPGDQKGSIDSFYWSSTPTVKLDDSYWAVSFSFGGNRSRPPAVYDSLGEVHHYPKLYVRLVKGQLKNQYSLSVKAEGDGEGEVLVDQEGVDCAEECNVASESGSQVELLAVPDPGSVFARWSGGCRGVDDTCVIDVTKDYQVRAHFLSDWHEVVDDNVILDKNTGLEWQRCTLGQTWAGGECLGRAQKRLWEEIKDMEFKFPSGWRLPTKNELTTIVYCDSGFPGFSESVLVSCLNNRTSPAIAGWVFPGTFEGIYLSSSEYSSGIPFVRDFSDGQSAFDQFNIGRYIRLVRDHEPPESIELSLEIAGPGSGKVEVNGVECSESCSFDLHDTNSLQIKALPNDESTFLRWEGLCKDKDDICSVTNWHEEDFLKVYFIEDRYELTGDDLGMVRDLKTGLEWQRCSFGQEWNGVECLGEASKLKFSTAKFQAFNQGWRVPTLDELHSLVFCRDGNPAFRIGVDDRCYGSDISPAIVTRYFPNTPEEDFWTITPEPDREDGFVSTIDFNSGERGLAFTENQFGFISQRYLRLVRDAESPVGNDVALTVSIHGNGAVSTDEPGVSVCHEDCTLSVPEGSSITLTATGENGYFFDGWSGCSSSNETCTLVVSEGQSVEAFFEQRSLSLEHCPYRAVSDDWNYIERNPNENISWISEDDFNVNAIARAFNHARSIDPSVHTFLVMPEQQVWDQLSLQQKGLYLVNAERAARGLKPYDGVDPAIQLTAQEYAEHILNNNQIIGHQNDGRSPMQRMRSDDYVDANADAFIRKPESVSGYLNQDQVPAREHALVRAIYGWLYEDKDWYKSFGLSSGDDWGHREQLLQPGLRDNQGASLSEGVAGFGVAAGLYQPSAETPSNYGAVTVFNTIDQGPDWDSDRIQSVDISNSQGCLPHTLDITDGGDLTEGLESLTISPSSVHMAMGQSQPLRVVGKYEGGEQRDLSNQVSFGEDKYSVVDIEGESIVALKPGQAQVYAQVSSVQSNRVFVTVGEKLDADDLTGQGNETLLSHLADNATLPSALQPVNGQPVESEFDPNAMGVYTGLVQDRYGTPMAGVQISFLNARNYGSATTDMDGRFVIAGPAGEQTLVYEKPAHLVVQRSATAASGQWASAETVTLLERDTKTTTIDLSSGEPQVHESSLVSDEFGSRKATLVFNGITSAVIRSADGSERPIERFEFSATEFETPSSMPGELPSETAFTWASDLKVAGTHYTDSVHFNGHVVMVVDNFLNFDVGEIVPIGYFDRRSSEWVASSNGVVVELLDANGDGQVDGLDYTGDGQPDDLNGNASTTDEAIGLDGYSAGETLWWGSFDHMTPVDYNWGVGDQEAPEEVDPELSEEDEHDDECVATGSYAKPYQQSFHEDIDIAGTNATLHYSSQRTKGYHHKIRVALSGEDLPPTVVNMIARLEIAGRVFEQRFAPQTSLEAEFVWDGTHPDGSIAQGLVSGRVSIGHEHAVPYLSAGNAATEGRSLSDFPIAWAVQGESETQVPSRDRFVAWRQHGISIKNTYDTQLAEGWALSSVHEFDPKGKVYLGNGGVQTVAIPSLILKTGQTFSNVQGDDGFYQAGGKDIDYAITGDNILQDQVTGLQWQNAPRPFRTPGKQEALQYCASLDLAGQTDWRLPTPKEIGYTIDKSAGDAIRRIHSLSRARELWSQDTLNTDQRELAAVCVRGAELDERNIDALERSDADQVVLDKDNGLMWQDSPENTSLTLNWLDSIDYCETSQHAGFDNWRLPNINELLYVLPNPVFEHQTSFPDNTPWNTTAPERNPYWSSTTNIANEDQAWAMESVGFNSERFDKGDQYHIRCVREDTTTSRMPYRFNGDGQHTATIDLDSGVELRTLEYDEAGRVTRIEDQFGNTLTVERNADGTPVRILAPNGEVTALTLDQQGNLTEVRYEDNSRYQFSYASGGLLTSKTDPNGNEYTREYDALGRLIVARDPMGGFWDLFDERLGVGWDRYGYDTAEANRYETRRRVLENGDVETITTEKTGAQTQVVRRADELTEIISAYGMNTRLEKVLDQKTQRPRTQTITVTTPNGLVNTTTLDKSYGENGADTSRYTLTANQNGSTLVMDVDTRSGITRITSAEGRQTTLHADPETLLTQQVGAPGLHERQFEYDSQGRLIEERVDNRTTAYIYDDADAFGQLTQITAPDGSATQFEYDLLGRVTQVTYPDGNRTAISYDANGNATRVTVPGPVEHESAFNGINKVATEDHPDTAPAAYTYNLERQLTRVDLPSGDAIEHIYNNGRLARTDTPEAQTHYHYQQGDQLTRVERGTEQAFYEYDGTLLTQLRYQGLLDKTLGYGYNPDFQINSLSYAGGTTPVEYDNDGLMTAIHGFALTYNAQSGLLEQIKDSNLTQTWQWNGYGEATAVDYHQSGQTTYGYDLAYDNAGRILGKTEQTPGDTATYEYDYDDRGRLVEVIKNGVIVEAYAYDANGNRTLHTSTEVGIEAQPASYTAGDQLASRGTTSYDYDANGRLSTKVEQTQTGPAQTNYVYASEGQLLQVVTPQKTINYRHNALGQRVAKVINGEIVEHYLWQNLTTLLATYDGEGNLKQRFEYTVGHTPTSFTQNGQRYYIQTDHLGSPRVITDSNGQVIKTLRYDSYGNITEDSNPDFEIPFGFAGGLYDPDTKLIRFGYRDYDPQTGRWTARDPIGFAGGDTNLYGYVLGDPVNFIDPTGEIFNLVSAGIGAVIGGVIGAVNAKVSGENVLAGAFQGAAVGTTAGFTFGGSLVGLAGNAAVSAAAEAARQQLTGECVDTEQIVFAGVFGVFGGNAEGIANGRSALNAIQQSRRPNVGSQISQIGSTVVSSTASGSLSVGVTAATQ